jgi:hypothetical protein
MGHAAQYENKDAVYIALLSRNRGGCRVVCHASLESKEFGQA